MRFPCSPRPTFLSFLSCPASVVWYTAAGLALRPFPPAGRRPNAQPECRGAPLDPAAARWSRPGPLSEDDLRNSSNPATGARPAARRPNALRGASRNPCGAALASPARRPRIAPSVFPPPGQGGDFVSLRQAVHAAAETVLIAMLAEQKSPPAPTRIRPAASRTTTGLAFMLDRSIERAVRKWKIIVVNALLL